MGHTCSDTAYRDDFPCDWPHLPNSKDHDSCTLLAVEKTKKVDPTRRFRYNGWIVVFGILVGSVFLCLASEYSKEKKARRGNQALLAWLSSRRDLQSQVCVVLSSLFSLGYFIDPNGEEDTVDFILADTLMTLALQTLGVMWFISARTLCAIGTQNSREMASKPLTAQEKLYICVSIAETFAVVPFLAARPSDASYGVHFSGVMFWARGFNAVQVLWLCCWYWIVSVRVEKAIKQVSVDPRRTDRPMGLHDAVAETVSKNDREAHMLSMDMARKMLSKVFPETRGSSTAESTAGSKKRVLVSTPKLPGQNPFVQEKMATARLRIKQLRWALIAISIAEFAVVGYTLNEMAWALRGCWVGEVPRKTSPIYYFIEFILVASNLAFSTTAFKRIRTLAQEAYS